MKLKEPVRAAFKTAASRKLDWESAQNIRREEFWKEIHKVYAFESVDPDKKHVPCEGCFRAIRDAIKKQILNFINSQTAAISQGDRRAFDLLGLENDWNVWQCIKFIIAFDMSFIYEADSYEDDDECFIEDYLDDEALFQYDVIKACDSLLVEGASLAKRIGSDSYRTWTAALTKLNMKCDDRYKAVDGLTDAIIQIWPDTRVWIAMNPIKVDGNGRRKKNT